MDLEEEMQKTLHAKPSWATTGDESLDFQIVEAERICAASKIELEALRKQVWDGRLELSDGLSFTVRNIIDACRMNSGSYLSNISVQLDYRETRGRTVIEQRNAKPQGSTDAEIAQRWQSLTRLLDSKPQNLILSAMQAEAGSDSLSRFCLRSRDAELYCQAKGLPVVDFFSTIAASADLLEPDIRAAAEDVALSLVLRAATIPAWERFTWSIDLLGKIGAQIFGPAPFASRKPIKAQSDSTGAVTIKFPDMNSFKEWARTPKI